MFGTAIGILIAIGNGVLIVWAWVSFICEAIARSTGTANRVPFLDVVLWARCGGAFLDHGFFGGARIQKPPVLHGAQQSQTRERRLHPRNADLRWRS